MRRQGILFNQKAMTLIELLVTLSLVVVVTTLLAALLKEGLVSYDRTVTEADLQLSVRHQSDVIVEDIRSSKMAVIGEVSYPLVIDHSKLILFAGTLEEQDTITYFLEGKNVFRQMNSAAPEIVFEDVNQFIVNLEEQLITVKIAVNPVTSHYQDPITKEIVLQARPRAALPTLSN